MTVVTGKSAEREDGLNSFLHSRELEKLCHSHNTLCLKSSGRR